MLKAKAANAGDCRGPGNYSKCAVVLLTMEMVRCFLVSSNGCVNRMFCRLFGKNYVIAFLQAYFQQDACFSV